MGAKGEGDDRPFSTPYKVPDVGLSLSPDMMVLNKEISQMLIMSEYEAQGGEGKAESFDKAITPAS